MNKYLGHTYEDVISGFKGICTGYVEYLTGCNQLLLVPKNRDNKRDGEWFDSSRLKLTKAKRVVLDNGKDPGFDKAAPIR